MSEAQMSEGFGFGFFDEADDALVIVDVHDAEIRGVITRNGNGGDGDVRFAFLVLGKDVAVIHAVELVTGEDEDVFVKVIIKVDKVLANGVRCAEVPACVGTSFLRRENFDESLRRIMIELIRLNDVAVQG